MVSHGTAYVGLYLAPDETLDTEHALSAATTALKRHDTAAGALVRRSKRRPAVMAETLGIALHPADGPQAPAVLKIITRGGPVPDDGRAPAILAETVLSLLETTDVSEIEWFSPTSRISAHDFISLHCYVSPRRQPVLPAQGNAEELLKNSIRAEPNIAPAEPEDSAPRASGRLSLLRRTWRLFGRPTDRSPADRRLGLAAWAMTGLMATISIPLAASLAIIGVLRGMDFRLATLVLSFCVILAGLQQSEMAPALPGAVTVLLN